MPQTLTGLTRRPQEIVSLRNPQLDFVRLGPATLIVNVKAVETLIAFLPVVFVITNYCGSSPISRETFPHVSYWALRKVAVAPGVSAPSVKKPNSAKRFLIFGSVRTLSRSRFVLFTAIAGVPLAPQAQTSQSIQRPATSPRLVEYCQSPASALRN